MGGKKGISDILAFQCVHCGHGDENFKVKPDGEVERVRSHGLYNCDVMCCNKFLDRRYLQYGDGNCECGVIIMWELGIILATEEQHKWREALFKGKFTKTRGREVRESLEPTFERLGIEKPQMIVWYVMAMGPNYLKDLLQMTRRDREANVYVIVQRLNGEFRTRTD